MMIDKPSSYNSSNNFINYYGLVITIDNPNNYEILSYGTSDIYGTSHEEYNVKMIDSNHAYINYSETTTHFYIEYVKYINESGNVAIRNYNENSKFNFNYVKPDSETGAIVIHQVSTPEELMNMNENSYYELSCDIDLTGYTWTPYEFKGYFDGKGHTISNLTLVNENEYSDTYTGIFINSTGTIKNVYFENIYFNIDTTGNLYTTILTSFKYSWSSQTVKYTFENILISGNININASYYSVDLPSGTSIYYVDHLNVNNAPFVSGDNLISYETFNSTEFKSNTLGWKIVSKESFNKDGLIYTVIDNLYILISGYNGENDTLVIPEQIDNLPVIGILDLAFEDNLTLKSITLPESLLFIGNSILKGCGNLEELVIECYVDITSNYLSKIFGKVKFYNSTNVKSLSSSDNWYYLPMSLKTLRFSSNEILTIGSAAFMNCIYLQTLEIPSSVTSIGNYAFENCTSLESITIPSSVIVIGKSVFSNCKSLEIVYYNGTIEDWCNISFSDYWSNPMYYYAKHFYMLDNEGVYKEVTEIVIPNTITSIGKYQFYGFNNITKITIPSSVTNIGSYAFYDCTSLEEVIFEENSQLTTIESGTFSYCTSLESITIPSSVTSIGIYAFNNCTSLESIIIPSSVKYIGEYAFFDCPMLINVYYNGTIEDWCNISFSDYWSNPMYYATHFYMLDNEENYKEVTEIEIPNTITSISDYRFYNFTSLKSIVIPSSVTSIGEKAFNNWGSLKIYCEVTSQPSGWNSNWKDYNIPVYWDIKSGEYVNLNGVDYLLDFDNNKASIIYYSGNDKSLEIPSSIVSNDKTFTVDTICRASFAGCKNLESVVVPSSVTTIGNGAFYNCTSLESITLPFIGGSKDNETYLGYIFGAFNYNENYIYVPSSLKEVVILDGCTSINDNAFNRCTSLEEVIFEENSQLTTIESGTFSYCTSLESITIPSSVTNIGGSSFSYCTSLESVYFNGTIEDWCNISFSNSYSNPMCKAKHFFMLDNEGVYKEVTEIVIPNTITSIGKYQFYGFNNITKITIPSSVTEIGECAFKNCTSLESIVISSNVTFIGNYAFYECTNLESVVIPLSVSTIETSAFSNCSNLKKIYCEASSRPSDWNDWSDCWSNESIVVWGYKQENCSCTLDCTRTLTVCQSSHGF